MFGLILVLCLDVSIVISRPTLEDNIFLQGIIHSYPTESSAELSISDTSHVKCEKGGSYTLAHQVYCDRYYLCSQGSAIQKECMEGMAFVHHIGCKPIRNVDCSGRPKLREPRGQCPEPDGVFGDSRGCGRYIKCQKGHPTSHVCPHLQVFDVHKHKCRRPHHDEYMDCYGEHKNEELIGLEGFKCPDPATAIYPFGTHSRHPYPGNCRYFLMCLKDGTVKLSGCEISEKFNPLTGTCEAKELVTSC